MRDVQGSWVVHGRMLMPPFMVQAMAPEEPVRIAQLLFLRNMHGMHGLHAHCHYLLLAL